MLPTEQPVSGVSKTWDGALIDLARIISNLGFAVQIHDILNTYDYISVVKV